VVDVRSFVTRIRVSPVIRSMSKRDTLVVLEVSSMISTSMLVIGRLLTLCYW